MKFEEVIIDGEKVKIAVGIDDELYEENYIEEKDNLDDTADLSKTIEFIIGENNE